ncbi:MAG: L,D-transpeptidase family protein [Anaerolineales bacterium]
MEHAQSLNGTNRRYSKALHDYQNRPKSKAIALGVGLLSFLVILPFTLFCITLIIFQVNALNLPGIYIYNKNVGLMSRDETEAYINKTWNQDRQIQLVSSQNPDIVYSLKPAELGIWIDVSETAKAANKFGRTADPFVDLLSALKGQTQLVIPTLYFNEEIARVTLETIAKELEIPSQNASIQYTDNEWLTIPAKQGQTIDIEATLDQIYAHAFNLLMGQPLPIQTKIVEPSVKDLSGVISEIDVLIKEFKFEAYDPITDEYFEWYVPEDIKRSWVMVNPQTYKVQFEINREEISNLLTQWELELGENRTLQNTIHVDEIVEAWQKDLPISAIVSYLPTTHIVESGESLWMISLKLGMPMWRILDANEGLTTNNLRAGMRLSIPPKDVLLPLPVVLGKRIIIDISEQTMRVYENGQVIQTFMVSTGMSDSPTMTGVFQILTHELNAYASNWDLYMPHFMGIYEAWPDFMNGIHGLPLLANGQRLWASNLGSPASYGCIILDLTAAENLYFWADPGVVVEIIP